MIIAQARNKNPSISAIIPVYNKQNSLKPLIQGLQSNHQHVSLEAVFVDDGSTDQSLSILKEAAVLYPWITLATQKNQGAGATRNAAAQLARSPIYSFLDADDLWLENHAIETLKCFEACPEAGLVSTAWTRYIDGVKTPSPTYNIPNDGIVQDHFLSLAWGQMYNATSSTSTPATLFHQIGGFETALKNGQDRAYWGEAYFKAPIWKSSAHTALWLNDTKNSLMSQAHKNRHPKYENWIEEKLLDFKSLDIRPDLNKPLIYTHMLENLVRDSEIIGLFAKKEGVTWMYEERLACLKKWGREDIAHILEQAQGTITIPGRLAGRTALINQTF